MKRINPFRITRRLALCLVSGGLLLLSLIACGGDSNVSVPAQTDSSASVTSDGTSSTDPEDSSTPVILSSLFENKTVTQVDYSNYELSYTTVHTTDSVNISALLSVLDNITAEPYTKHCLCGVVDVPSGECCVNLRFDDGDTFLIYPDKESQHLYFQYNSNSGQQYQRSHLKITEDDWTQFMSFVTAQYETLFPLMQVPSPEEYLLSATINSTLRHGNNSVTLTTDQTALIMERIQTALADLPIVKQYPEESGESYRINLFYSDNQSVSVTLNTMGMLTVNLDLTNQTNTYCYQIPQVNAQEYGYWLQGLCQGDEDSDLPTLNKLLEQSMYKITFYDADPASYLVVNDRYTIQPILTRLQKLNFSLLSDEIPEDDRESDGIKILLEPGSGIDVVLEFDSSGWINCRCTMNNGKITVHEAQYTLSDEDMAALMEEISKQKAAAAELPSLNDYFAETSLLSVSYYSAKGVNQGFSQPKRKLLNLSDYLQTVSFARVDDDTEIEFSDYPKLILQGSSHSLELWLDLETGYVRVVWDARTASFIPPQIYKITAEEARGIADLIGQLSE